MILQKEFESYLQEKVLEGKQHLTKEAMAYSLLDGGKRVRPQLLMATLKGYGMDPALGFPCACAIEMIHTYSLIHDDLPAMDDDDLRRGKPTNHKYYDEATAILAGDSLLTRAFEVVCETEVQALQIVDLVKQISHKSGVDGMIYGQELDIIGENNKNISYQDLLDIDEYKTAKLLTLPMVCAAIIANRKEDIPVLEKIGYYVGVQFQIQDDILDVTISSEQFGKSTSDQDNHKSTFVSLLGLEKAKQMVIDYDCLLKKELTKLEMDTSYLEEIFNTLLTRTY
ncbi:MAG: polyprenyl synthetase family protein [Bacillota bacterium]|nr:polyprenyl synthetase family protein [Bacillota bacterium]